MGQHLEPAPALAVLRVSHRQAQVLNRSRRCPRLCKCRMCWILAGFGALNLRAAGKVGGFDQVVKLVRHVVLVVLGKHFVGIE